LLEPTLPNIVSDVVTMEYGRFIIGPLEGGYGTTLGNALRRVLLSSLSGAAVASVKISDVYHEFSPIPYAKEDTTRLLLNLKKLRLKSHSDDSVRLPLEAKGEGIVTAGDIQCPTEVEIINPELHLLTLNSDDAELDMELVVQQGKGYSPAEERGSLPIGEIPVDAIFSPIRKVNYKVERTRVGRMTNYDRLTIEIWTDGTIEPEEALSTAAEILVTQFSFVATLGKPEAEEELEEGGIPTRVYDALIDDLGLSVRAFNCLKRAGITKVGKVLEMLQRGDDEILQIRNFGKKSLEELKAALRAKGFLPEKSKEETEVK
jgi:DNA-directed RNA polymerase subunit alpha